MGFADSPATRNVLANSGIRFGGYRWRWALGLKGGTYPPHRRINGRFGNDENAFLLKGETIPSGFRRWPRLDVNKDTCMCATVPLYRTADGKVARPSDVVPLFIPPGR